MKKAEKQKVKKIGGRIYSDFVTLEREINSINEEFFPLFKFLGFSSDITEMLNILNSSNFAEALQKAFIQKELSKATNTPESKKELISFKLRAIAYFKKVLAAYTGGNSAMLEPSYNKRAIELCREALYTTPDGIEIKGEKFIEIYSSYMEANKSETKKLHEQVAETINRFFNGVPITQEELSKYFIINGGLVAINPKSINAQDYARLGRTHKEGMAQSSELKEPKERGGNRKRKSNT